MSLTIQSLTKNYGWTHVVLTDVSFDFEKGSIVGVLGKNGVGKSTLLRSLARLETILAGTIQLGGKALTQEDLSFVLLSDYYYRNKTVSTVLKEFQLLFDQFDVEKAQRLLKEVHIDVERRVADLSSGTRQKLEIALTLAKKAQVYLFDEPFSHVDYAARSEIKQMIQANANEETIILLTTNILEHMDTLLTDILVINNRHQTISYHLETMRESTHQSLKELYLEETQ